MPITTGAFVKNLIAPGFMGYAPTEAQIRESLAWSRLPVVNVNKPSGSLLLETRASLQRSANEHALVPPSGRPSATEWKFTTDTFTTQEYGLEYVITKHERQNAQGIYDPDARAAKMLMLKVMRAVEMRFVTLAFATSVWTATGSDAALGASVQWNSTGGGDPKGKVRDAKVAIQGVLDFEPRYVVFSNKDVKTVLEYHAAFTDVVGILNGQRQTPADLPAIAAGLNVDDYGVSGLVKVTTNEGAATTTTANVVPDGFLVLALTAGNPFEDLGPSAACVLVNEPLKTVSFPDPYADGATVVQARVDLLIKVLDAKLGYFIDDTLA
jgi:hypothetical protein